MKINSYIIAACMVITGCTSEQLYQYLGSPPPQGPPTTYPLNFPLCSHDLGIIIIPLGIIVYRDTVPNAEYIMLLTRQYPDKNPCEILREESVRNSHWIEKKDHWERVSRLDKSGRGYFSASYYHFNLMNNETLQENERKERSYEEFQAKKLIRDGRAIKEFIDSEEMITINGMEWHHQVVGSYWVTSFDPSHPRDQSDMRHLYDLYEHRFDESHVFQYKGHYGDIILAHPELLEDRRHMTRRLVEGFRYEFLTPEQIELIVDSHG